MDNTELALAMREHHLEKIAVYLSRCGLTSNAELTAKGYPDLGWVRSICPSFKFQALKSNQHAGCINLVCSPFPFENAMKFMGLCHSVILGVIRVGSLPKYEHEI